MSDSYRVALAIRLSGLLLLGVALYVATWSLELIILEHAGGARLFGLLLASEFLIIALLIGSYPAPLAAWLMPNRDRLSMKVERTRPEAFRLGFFMLGAVLFINSVRLLAIRLHAWAEHTWFERGQVEAASPPELTMTEYMAANIWLLVDVLAAFAAVTLWVFARHCARWLDARTPSPPTGNASRVGGGDHAGGEQAQPTRRQDMKVDPWAVVIVRLCSALLALLAVYIASAGMWYQVVAIPAALAALLLALAGVLAWFPNLVARSVYGSVDQTRDEASASAPALYDLGFVLLGAFVLVYAVSDALVWLVRYILMGFTPNLRFAPDDWLLVAATGIEILLGIGLIVGRRRLTRLAYRIRYAT